MTAPRVSGVWQLAWPSITAFALQSGVGMVDLVFVSQLGTEVVAGVGLASQLQFASLAMISGVTTGTVALVARAMGAGDRSQAEVILRASLMLALGLGAVLMAIAPFAKPIIRLFGISDPAVEIGGSYLQILLFGGIPLAIGITFASALRGAGDVRTPLWVGLGMNAINVVGDYALIFGHFGAPALGADGSAIASVLTFTVGASVYGLLWRSRSLVLSRSTHRSPIDRGLYRRIGRVGIPTGIEQLSFNSGLFLFVGVISGFGTEAVAAYFIGVRVINFSLIPGMGFQIAAATLVGQHLGAGRPDAAARSGWRATTGAAGAMSALGLAIALGAETVVSWFGAVDASTATLAALFLYIICAAQPLMALEFGVGGSLRGAGDTRFPLVAQLAGLFVCRLGGALVVIHGFDGSIQAVWLCVLIDYAAKGTLLAWRFWRGRWKTLTL